MKSSNYRKEIIIVILCNKKNQSFEENLWHPLKLVTFLAIIH